METRGGRSYIKSARGINKEHANKGNWYVRCIETKECWLVEGHRYRWNHTLRHHWIGKDLGKVPHQQNKVFRKV